MGVIIFVDIMEKRREPERDDVPSGAQFLVLAESLVMNFVGKFSNSGFYLALNENIGCLFLAKKGF